MNTDTLQSAEIPLKKLLAWNGNVRLTAADQGIEELATSIASVGLLQNLIVRKEPRGKFAVVAGRRRLLALSHLLRTGTLKPAWTVPCQVAAESADLTEISLTENVMRAAMHPADEFVAFQKLIEDGRCIADVAARFGVTEAVVQRRLALARVSPVLLQEYRQGHLNLEVLQAFTLSDDHAAQEEVWNSLPSWNRTAHSIRQMLSTEAIPATDRRVRFVGLDRYEAAAGLVRRDLFAEGEEGVQILDPAKLMRLVSEKLETLAEQVKADGWKWVEIQADPRDQVAAQLRRLPAEDISLSDQEDAEIDKLAEQREALEEQLSDEDDDANETLYQRIDEITEAIEAIYRSQEPTYSNETKAKSGVVISIGHTGEPAYAYGLLRKEDERELTYAGAAHGTAASEDGARKGASAEEEPAPYSASLVETLTMHKTAAIAVELVHQPQMALAALVHALVLSKFGLELQLYRSQSSLQISTSQPYLAGAANSPAALELEEQRKQWLVQLPRQDSDLWAWCVEQEQDTLLRLLAFCAAMSVNAVQSKAESESHQRLQHANRLAFALNVDMTKWFTPTAENVFGRISKPQITAALSEAGKATPDATKWKKAELAALAEKEIQGTGWLPAPVRVSIAEDHISFEEEARDFSGENARGDSSE